VRTIARIENIAKDIFKTRSRRNGFVSECFRLSLAETRECILVFMREKSN
jgi:hypothetical protein